MSSGSAQLPYLHYIYSISYNFFQAAAANGGGGADDNISITRYVPDGGPR